MLALGDLIDALLSTPLGVIEPDYLKDRVNTLLRCCEAAGWRDMMTPKFHWMIHYPYHLKRWGTLPTCWVHERKHRMVKRFGTDIANHRRFSHSVLSEVVHFQLSNICQEDACQTTSRLDCPSAAPKVLAELVVSEYNLHPATSVLSSPRARLGSSQACSMKDVVIFLSADGENFVAGRISRFCQVNDSSPFALVAKFDFESADDALGCAHWREDGSAFLFVELRSVLASVMWTERSPGVVRTLIPFQFRGLHAVAE